MNAHTPGPWRAMFNHGSLPEFNVWLVGPNPGEIVTSFAARTTFPEQDRREADAHLIAAAPDLLSLVQRFVALPSGAWHPARHAAEEMELMAEARAAIAKATQEVPA